MKNLILSFAVACVATVACTQQSFAQAGKPRYGIKAGATLMTMGSISEGSVSVNYKSVVGFQGGVYMEHPINDMFGIAPQLLYTQKGGSLKISENGNTFETKSKFNYLELPVLLQIKAQPNFNLYVGPQVSFLMSQSSTLSVTGMGSASDSSTEGLTKTIVGANIGAGYNFTPNVSLNLHYTIDLAKWSTEEEAKSGMRNSGLAFTVGYSF